MRYNI